MIEQEPLITHHEGRYIDAIIVGGGLFGKIIAKALEAQGRYVVIMDACLEGSGSKPAACLMKPSWFSGLGKGVYEPALELLDKLYGVQNLTFTAGKVLNATVHWIPPKDILGGGLTVPVKVTRVRGTVVDYLDPLDDRDKRATAPLVVVAAGIWTEKLLPRYKQVAQKGVAFLLPDENLEHPFIHPWAPYRQVVAFNRGDGLWVSDGTAILEKNWTGKRVDTARRRCLGHPDLPIDTPNVQVLTGIRPYYKAQKPCLLEEVVPGLWVASGGAKNGTLAAGWCAHEISRRTA